MMEQFSTSNWLKKNGFCKSYEEEKIHKSTTESGLNALRLCKTEFRGLM